jgi:transcriptional regulator with XRE-family HTH domain
MTDDPKQHRREKVAWHLQRLRTRDRLTQGQVAERVGVRREHVNRWENAIWEPGPTYLALLANLFDVEELEFYREPARC